MNYHIIIKIINSRKAAKPQSRKREKIKLSLRLGGFA
jgi:hypothetical protein